MLSELAIALRRLARRPSFSLPAVATIAVGVGATTAIFSAVDAALLRPLPYPDPDDLYTLRSIRVDGRWSNGDVSAADLAAIVAGAPSVMEAAGWSTTPLVILTDDGRNRQVLVRTVTPGFFDLVGLPMEVGRPVGGDEPEEGLFGSVVLSHGIWEDVFARDPNVVGSTLRLSAGPATIVGVAPPELDLPERTDIWLGFTPSATSTFAMYQALLRVRPGTSREVLRAELESVMAGRIEADAETANARAFQATPLVDAMVGDLGPILLIVLGGAGILLAIGGVNVTTLILARGVTQTRELAIRKAVGARSGAIVRHLFAESLVLGMLGTALGMALAWIGMRALLASGAEGLPRLDGVAFDARVLLFAVATLLAVTMLVGLLPAVPLARVDVRSLLGGSGWSASRGRGGRRLMSLLIVAEIACAITLVAGAGWLVRSYANLTGTDPGFTARGRLVFEPTLLGSSYMPVIGIVHGSNGPLMLPDRTGATPETWLRDVTERLAVVDGVEAVGLTSALPLRRDPDAVVEIAVPGEPRDPGREAVSRMRNASPSLFEALGVRLLAGRTFADDEPASSVVVNEAFVRAHLPGRESLGATFAWGSPTVDLDNLQTVIGVVADVRHRSLREAAEPAFYRRGYPSRGAVVVSTSASDATSLIPAVRAAAGAVDASIPITIEPLEEILAEELVRHRLGLVLMSLFAVVSLALAGIGIYGVVGHVLALRSGELAVRAALGEGPRGLVITALREGPLLWLAGTSIGLVSAYVAGRLASVWLVQVRASDPAILLVAVTAVSGLAWLAFLVPAIRGARVGAAAILRAP